MTMRAWGLSAKGLFLLAVVTLAQVSASRAAAQGYVFESLTGFCLDIRGASLDIRGDAIVWDCHGGTNQQFNIVQVDGPWYALQAVHSGLCLDVQGASTANGANVFQWTCSYNANQQWQFVDLGDGTFALKARHSGKCLDVRGASGWHAGTDVIQWDCHYGTNQSWF